jgi:hypothetical protein
VEKEQYPDFDAKLASMNQRSSDPARQKLDTFLRGVSNYRKVGFFSFDDKEQPRRRKQPRKARSLSD